MNAPDALPLPDVQSNLDPRRIAISQVGIKSLRHPLRIATEQGVQSTVAGVDMYVALPADRKGTHMSRFIEVLQGFEEPLDAASLPVLLRRMLAHLDAEEGSITLRFPFFMRKTAPVSGAAGTLDYDVRLRVEARAGTVHVWQKTVVPVTSLCPCSKEISDYGAHNQRAHITLDLELAQPIAIEAQIRTAERAASCELWSVLKRVDEKYVTERAYDNPQFVEDVVRDVALALQDDTRILALRVSSENFEAIHNHSAFACIERDHRSRP